ncbi:hypothetical protein PPYR_00958 [Photinus pyralis]|uniref:Antistasin-like domain-containing protein n=1 Tax=Photinus pyralis TaxID=7054 RepID=A0A5N4B380_PHOPY|nr:antistasin-like isoform X2 [Photinus pyralis]KAB0803988.1 hypothetical protein PPYR_00958 [Photinus pyralis]
MYLSAALIVGLCASGLATRDPCEYPPCDVFCPYGHVTDQLGCKTCACLDPCANKSCGSEEECEVQISTQCVEEPWEWFIGNCRPKCPVNDCISDYCPYGNARDENGCVTCECVNHCKNQTCGPDQTCITEHFCSHAVCGMRVKCTKRCEDLPCHSTEFCEYGFELDRDNCATCNCNQPCQGVVCPLNQYCFVSTIYCVTLPCPPPTAICQSFCPEGSALFTGAYDSPVKCTNSRICPKGYTCRNATGLSDSHCCETITA